MSIMGICIIKQLSLFFRTIVSVGQLNPSCLVPREVMPNGCRCIQCPFTTTSNFWPLLNGAAQVCICWHKVKQPHVRPGSPMYGSGSGRALLYWSHTPPTPITYPAMLKLQLYWASSLAAPADAQHWPNRIGPWVTLNKVYLKRNVWRVD